MIPIPPYMPGMPAAPLGMPVGSVVAFAGQVGHPASQETTDIGAFGWMVCDGSQLEIGQYPELFAALGFLYVLEGESTDPSTATQFRIPNYQGYFLRGVYPQGATNPYPGQGSMPSDPDASKRVLSSGDKSSSVGSLQLYALQSHKHDYQQANLGSAQSSGNAAVLSATTTPTDVPVNDGQNADTFQVTENETRSRNVYVYYIIKYTLNISYWSAYLPGMPRPGEPGLP